MKPFRHLFRDVVVFSLPVLGLVVYLAVSALASFFSAEVANFHGYPVRSLRAGGLQAALTHTFRPLGGISSRRYLADGARRAVMPPPVRQFDLRVDGTALDQLDSALPGSGRQWLPAALQEGQELVPVEVHYRGQQMSNFFWRIKAWKLKTPRRRLVDGYRVINLTPLQGRLESHLTFMIAKQAGLQAPRSRIVQLYLNLKDQGLYLQEEQVDELMIRRIGRMPGDIFYGELFFPAEPKMSSDDLFWNPYLWEKKDRNNEYSDEHRPYLTELFDHIADESPQSFNRLLELLDVDQFSAYLAVIAFQGDLHVDHSHNHRLYFNPLTGKFEGLLWNPRLTTTPGEGVESMANRFFRKLARDPRFLDRVQANVYRRLHLVGATERQLDELERIRLTYADLALDRQNFMREIEAVEAMVATRGETVADLFGVGEAVFEVEESASASRLNVFARAVASLRLEAVELDEPANGLRLVEDRDFDGELGPADRELPVRAEGRRLVVLADDALLYVGRDFRAPYVDTSEPHLETFQVMRSYTRLAYLESPLLLVPPPGEAVPEVVGLECARTVGEGPVEVRRGSPAGYVATETIHPWRLAGGPPPTRHRFSGRVELTEDLVVGERDTFDAKPGTEMFLGPGVSLVFRSRVHLDGIKVRRLQPDRPWGVIAIQGLTASGSVIEDCDLEGGSEDTIRHVYYSGMLSVHQADQVAVRNCVFSDNVLGDDTVRFADANGLEIDSIRIDRANGDAIDCDLSSGVARDVVVDSPRNDGFDLMTSRVDIERLEVRGAGDKGISFGERSESKVALATIVDSTTGVALKDGSDPVLTEVTIRGCGVGVDGFDKNWRYPGGGRGRFVGCRLLENEVDVRLDSLSELTLENCLTGGRFTLTGGGDVERLRVVGRPAEMASR